MNQIKPQRITVLKGGPGSERTISHASAKAVVAALRELGLDVTEVDVTDPGFELPVDTELVFNIIHGTYGEDGQLQCELEKRGVPYTGEGVLGSELAFDKLKSKARFIERGVPTPRFEIVPAGQAPKMPVPYVIKAPCEGSSVGVFIVKTEAEAAPAIEGAAKFAKELLVEQFVEGRELTVGIIADQALPIIEIRPRTGFYDWTNKYPFLDPTGKGGADHYCPAALDAATTALVQQIALAAKDALDLQVYSRVDLLLPADGQPVVLEINTIPGMTESSLVPEAAKKAGIPMPQLLQRVIELSLTARPPRE
ncbi:MAG: D-alanine--D-alanine ligase [Chthoniobacteraceae bacterium]